MSNIEDERRAHPPPKFVSGSILRHILEMTAAGAVGLMAIFLGDLANIYFLSLSGDQTVVAAVGYASSILFLSTSIGIGLSIATASIVAPAIGGGHREAARRLSTHAHVLTFAVSAALSAVLWLLIPQLLSLLGATGEAHAAATRYLKILIPTLPLLAGGMTSSSVLRSVGDAKRSMLVTLYGAIVNTILDAILILKLGLGIEGAAMSSTLARATVAGIGLYGVACVHKLLERPNLASMADDTPAFAAIALPAVLTNIATPVSNAYVTWAIAPYGNGAIAGWAVIGRIIPVAFGSVYALSGVVGPIIGRMSIPARVEFSKRFMPAMLLIMPTIVTMTLAAGFQLAGEPCIQGLELAGAQPHRLLELGAGDRIQGGGGLVEQQDLRANGDAASDAKALLLASGQAGAGMVQLVLHLVPEGGAGERLLDPGVHVGLGQVFVEADPEGHVVIDRHRKGGRLLEHHADP